MPAERGIFTLSLDCEGLWGMADNRAVFDEGRINRTSLAEAYEFVRQILGETGLVATMAFVDGFAAPVSAVRECLPQLEELADLAPHWFEHLLPRIRDGGEDALDGLEGHALWTALKADGHEMAWHGSTHLPLEGGLPQEAVRLELALGRKLQDALGHRSTSIVFPRNQVGHLSELEQAGFTTYRASKGQRLAARLCGLGREFLVFDRGDRDETRIDGKWCISPAGQFLNWPSGARGLVPAFVTRSRWRSMLGAAVADARHVHMWFHPHNLITAPAMRDTFAAILRDVGHRVRTGELLNLTMAQAELRYRNA